jgi:hypothetical protein
MLSLTWACLCRFHYQLYSHSGSVVAPHYQRRLISYRSISLNPQSLSHPSTLPKQSMLPSLAASLWSLKSMELLLVLLLPKSV